MKMEKIATAMVEVLRAPVMSRKGLAGMNPAPSLGGTCLSTRCRGWSARAPRAVSAAPANQPLGTQGRTGLDISIPAPAAIMSGEDQAPMRSGR